VTVTGAGGTTEPPAGEPAVRPEPAVATGSRRMLVLVGLLVLTLLGAGAFVLIGGDDGPDTVAGAPEPVVTEGSAPATAAPVTTDAPTTTQEAVTTTSEETTTTLAGPAFPVLPDGSPEPIVAIFNGPTVRLTGWVPSEEKADMLIGLAKANSNDPNAVVDAELQIDPNVPLNIGVRVLEMQSPRFPSGSAEVTMEHAAQLDRVANVMNLLPNTTVTVVGHADQVGDETANYVLSEARAVSVVRYLVGKGIAPNRLAARAVGEQDLLIADETETALELNRRTEFIFYGLLAD
jgi:outer membrane protein OmpA-like peptidoglycan-associated protein